MAAALSQPALHQIGALWIMWTTTIATKPRLWRHVLPSHENETEIEDSHDFALFTAAFGLLRRCC
jgi:hypothetical protein